MSNLDDTPGVVVCSRRLCASAQRGSATILHNTIACYALCMGSAVRNAVLHAEVICQLEAGPRRHDHSQLVLASDVGCSRCLPLAAGHCDQAYSQIRCKPRAAPHGAQVACLSFRGCTGRCTLTSLQPPNGQQNIAADVVSPLCSKQTRWGLWSSLKRMPAPCWCTRCPAKTSTTARERRRS